MKIVSAEDLNSTQNIVCLDKSEKIGSFDCSNVDVQIDSQASVDEADHQSELSFTSQSTTDEEVFYSTENGIGEDIDNEIEQTHTNDARKTRSGREITRPIWHQDYDNVDKCFNINLNIDDHSEVPTNENQALNCHENAEWKSSMLDEMNNLMKNKTCLELCKAAILSSSNTIKVGFPKEI